jgi:hypothetical protein
MDHAGARLRKSMSSSLRHEPFDRFFESLRLGTANLLNLLPSLPQVERWQGANALRLQQLLRLIAVIAHDFEKVDWHVAVRLSKGNIRQWAIEEWW